ncbi:hypothetical protein RHMOL_Rhmol01G0021300 [Rhododendron molle]|uniref:Uncharacterized protein n=1 Tax=Rhododendron molle TaxID=49168 RepID=A0ACC0PXR0_RHOML|nr:hypothetical protein RHMOL_Rhmol01G0021300 [Rhododendron molle]
MKKIALAISIAHGWIADYFEERQIPLAYVVKNALLDIVFSILESFFHLGNVEPKDGSDQVGRTPDVQCTTEMLNSPPKERDVMGSPLVADSCSMVAEHELDVKESEGAASKTKFSL